MIVGKFFNAFESHIEPELYSKMIKGAIGSFILQVGFAGLSFLNAIILARILGSDGYGAFSNAMAWVSLLVIPATFGFGTMLVRGAAIYPSRGQWSLLKGILRFSNSFVLILSVVLSLAALLVAPFLFSGEKKEVMRLTFWAAVPLVPLLALYTLQESTTRGFEYVIRACFPGMIIRPGLLLCGAIIIYFYWQKLLSAPMMMLVNVCAGIMTLGVSILWLNSIFPTEAKTVKPKYTPWPWLHAAFPMMVFGGMQIVLGQTDIVMLGAIKGAKDVGLYAAASRLAYLLVYVMMAFNVILAPIAARLYATEERAILQKIMSKAVRIAFFMVLPFGLSLVFIGNYFLSIFGDDFLAARVALIILAIGRLLDVALGPCALVLSLVGHERIVGIVFTVISLSNIILNAFLIPIYGLHGAAIASMISLVSAKFFLSMYTIKNTDLNTTVFAVIP